MTIVGLFVPFVTIRRVPYGKKANEDTFSVVAEDDSTDNLKA